MNLSHRLAQTMNQPLSVASRSDELYPQPDGSLVYDTYVALALSPAYLEAFVPLGVLQTTREVANAKYGVYRQHLAETLRSHKTDGNRELEVLLHLLQTCPELVMRFSPYWALEEAREAGHLDERYMPTMRAEEADCA